MESDTMEEKLLNSAVPKSSPWYNDIRRLRKKLRQIEQLKLSKKTLGREEEMKVNSRDAYREELNILLSKVDPEDDDTMKRPSASEEDLNIVKKKAKNTFDVKCEEPDYSNFGTKIKGNEASGIIEDATAECISSEVKASSSCIVKKENPNQKDQMLEHSQWKNNSYKVFTLEGHNDIILSVDCTEEFIISASRDTTVKVWRVSETKEERSLRGHTGSVTSVAFLPIELSRSLLRKFQDDPEFLPSAYSEESPECKVVAVSGSLDCTLRVWDISTGESFGSIYTYNGITVMHCGTWGIVTGTEGGKLEVWCITGGNRSSFINAFQSEVSALYIDKDHIYAGSSEGDVGIWKYDSSSRTLSSLYAMESESQTYVPLKRLASLISSKGVLYIGDSGTNIKVLDWKKGNISRLRNDRGDTGMTDSLVLTEDGYLLASSFSIDTGCSSINVREVATGKYICSFADKKEDRYLSVSCAQGIIVTGGHHLKVWIQGEKWSGQKKNQSTGIKVIPKFYQNLSMKAADSASEDNTDWASSSDEDNELEDTSQVIPEDSSRTENSWWCSIL